MPSQNGDRKDRAPNLKGARELMLIQDLAVGDTSYSDLAEKHGVSESTIVSFAKRNKHRIAEVAQNQLNELAGLWLARKGLRVATYQAEIERNIDLIQDMQDLLPGYSIPPDSDKITRLQNVILKAVSLAAAEAVEADLGSPQPVRFPEGMDWGEDDQT